MKTEAFSLLLSLSILFFAGVSAGAGDEVFGKRMNRRLMGLKKEKLSHFKFYWHDILSGPKPTSIRVVPPVSNSSMTLFGSVTMIDNPLTLGPNLTSKLVGRAQGFYASASQNDLGFLMFMNLVFVEGKYNGSTLTVLGRNPAMSAVREMSVSSGSGLFRFARGYAQAKTHWLDFNTGDATVEYNVYVFHY